MLNTITDFLGKIDNFVWGLPLIILILATGVFLTVRLRGLQIIRFPLAIRYMFSSDEEDGNGEVSSFAALCTALSATIGTGNIVGVATAIVSGGPGALFWMWMAAIVGTATKYAECLLAVKYRVVEKDGHIIGGPFYYIENGMGKQFRWCKPTHKMKIYDVQNENKHVNNAEYYRINANFNTINSNNYTFIGNIKGYHVI